MQVRTLHKLLGKLIEKGFSHKSVVIDKRTFTHPLESDGVCYLDVSGHKTEWIFKMDDDGGTKTRADGTECGGVVVILVGDNHPLTPVCQQQEGAVADGI